MIRPLAAALAISLLGAASTAALAQARPPGTVKVWAADALKDALPAVGRAFEAAAPGWQVEFVFGPSATLRDRLQGGERADLFAAANMAHPMSLAQAGRAEPVDRFARNPLCALASPRFQLQVKRLAERLADPLVKLASPPPHASASGDHAQALFDRIEAQGQGPKGVAAVLKAKAAPFATGPDAQSPPGTLLAEGRADVYITDCIAARAARQAQPALKLLDIPADINVPAAYGLAVLKPASEGARQFTAFLLGGQGQQALASSGLVAP